MPHLLMVLGFVWWWPVGLAALIFLIARRRAQRRAAYTGGREMFGWDRYSDRFERRVARAQEKVQRAVSRAERYYGAFAAPSPSGNRAFDEYRQETLKRLEDEQHEFHDFLGRLRVAKDRAEFDAFMADRRRREAERRRREAHPPAPPAAPAPQG